MASVSEGSSAYSRAIVSKCEVVVWLSPAKLLRRCGNTVLLLIGVGTSLPDLVQVLVLAVFLEVILVLFLLEHFVEAEGILLCVCLVDGLLLDDVVMLEIVEVRVLSLEKLKFLFNCFPRQQSCVAVFFLNMEDGLAAVISMK